MTLRARIAAVAGLAVAVAILATAVFTYLAVRSSLRGEIDDALSERADQVSDGPPAAGGRAGGRRERSAPARSRRLPAAAGRPSAAPPAYAQLVTPDGHGARARPASRPRCRSTTAHARSRATGRAATSTDMDVDGTHVRVLTQAAPAGARCRWPARSTRSTTSSTILLIALIVLGGVGIALGVGLGALVARAALVPIGRFTSRTEAAGGDLDPSQRMEVVGDDELARLARSFNTTLDALERSVEAQRHLVADASHELRTPIASLRANIQTLQDADRLPADERERMRADIVEELDELTALVADVVELARGTKPGEALDDVRLDRVVEDLVARAQRRAGGDIEIRGRARADAGARRARADRPGGVEPARQRGEVEPSRRRRSRLDLAGGVLTVRDHGPGFDEDDLPHVFERFYRAAARAACRARGSASRSCSRPRRRTAGSSRRPTRPAAARCCA